jgi:hypothetical protein
MSGVLLELSILGTAVIVMTAVCAFEGWSR